MDLALTIKVHPIALGIRAESTGRIHVPENVHLDVSVVTNTFAYNDRSSSDKDRWCEKKTLAPGFRDIPEPIHGLKLRVGLKNPNRLDAVLVTEHKNLDTVFVDGEHTIKHVLLVMVRSPISLQTIIRERSD